MILKSKINKGAGFEENPVAITQRVMRSLFFYDPRYNNNVLMS